MGNERSGWRWRPHPPRLAVEECLTLRIDRFDALHPPAVGRHSWPCGSWLNYELQEGGEPEEGPVLVLCYTIRKQSWRLSIAIEEGPRRELGRPRWFRCPSCSRRCGRLHLPPDGGVFACRLCHRLSYISERFSGYGRRWADAWGFHPKLISDWLRRTGAGEVDEMDE